MQIDKKDQNYIKYLKIIQLLGKNFQASFDSDLINFWWESFQIENISFEQIKTAAREILRTRTSDKSYKTMPNYGDFIRIIEGSPKDKAEQQSKLVLEKLNYAEYNYKFDDPVTLHLMSKVWPFKTWGSTVLDRDLEFWPKKFIDAYIAFQPKKDFLQISQTAEIKKLTENIGDI